MKRFIDLHIFAFQDHQQNINVAVCDEIVWEILKIYKNYYQWNYIDNRHCCLLHVMQFRDNNGKQRKVLKINILRLTLTIKLINFECKFIFWFPIQFFLLTCFIRKHETQFVMQSFAVYENNFFKYKSFFFIIYTLVYLLYYKNNALFHSHTHAHTYKLQFIIASRNFVSLWSHHRQMEI